MCWARASLVIRLEKTVLLVCGVALAVLLATATAKAAAPAGTIENFQGSWRANININGTDVPFLWVVAGEQFSTFVEGQPIPFATGKFAVLKGRWSTTPANLPPDGGPFHFVDADTVSMTGVTGKEVIWRRAKIPGAQKESPIPPAAGAQIPAAVAATASILEDFAGLRQGAKTIAQRWNAAAQMMRVDMWGSYSSSRFKPTGARLIYFVPKSAGLAMQVRVENNTMQSSSYHLDLDLVGTPEALPERVLTAEAALRRLWDLAPTVRQDQVYLQLIRPGVEKPVQVEGDAGATGYPLFSFLQKFPVPLRDKEMDIEKGKAVWRMLAVRDHDVVVDKAYGAFVYVDAASGAALSRRQPAVGVQIFMRHGLWPPSPIGLFAFSRGQIPLDSPAEQVGTFDALAVAQKSESMDLGLRAMVADGRSDDEIRAAIDKMCNWAAKIEQVRKQDGSGGIGALQDAVKRDPKDVRAQVALFKRYVDEVEKEKKAALASPFVTKIRGLNKLSEFWLEKQFEVAPEALGTRNQTHMVLDTRTSEWIYKMEDPPNTRMFSKYFAPSLEVLRAIRAMKRDDYDLQKQVTRLNWLIGGNTAAVGQENWVSPIDPLQLMAYAELNRVKGSEKMLEAAQLRTPKTWSTTSRRDLGDKIEVTTTTYTRQPTADELAAADRLDLVAKGTDAPRVAAVQDLALKLQPMDARIFYMWSRIEATYYDAQLADRVAIHGLLLDPGCAELHAARLIAWKTSKDVNKAELYLAEKFASRYTPADLTGGASLAKLDPVSGYFLSLQRLRLDPENVGAHAAMCDVLGALEGTKMKYGVEIMPDAGEQRQRELGVCALMMARLLDRPNEWSKAVPPGMPATRENLMKISASFHALRGQELASMQRGDEARVCFQKALAIDPSNDMARKGMR